MHTSIWRGNYKFPGSLWGKIFSRSVKKAPPGPDDIERSEKCEWDLSCCKMRTTAVGECHDDMAAIPRDVEQPCVVIIGAGVAGLSAARRLIQCGISKVTVLEALDRPGGRIRSCWLGDSVVELGSEYIVGACIANKIYTLAAQEGIIRYPIDRIDEHPGPMLTSDGRSMPKALAQKAAEIFDCILSRTTSLCHLENQVSKECLINFIEDEIISEIETVEEPDRYDVTRALYGLANCLRSKLGEDLTGVSTTGFGCYRQLPGGLARVRLGMAGILSPLLRELPEGTVQYCKPVHAIRWGTTGGGCNCPRALVLTDDNTPFPADYVIVTFSLGVLKIVSDCMFCPALPAVKMDAITSVGFGNVNKIFLQYDRPFWTDKGCQFGLAWAPQEMEQRDSWTKGVSGFQCVAGSSKNICITLGGPEAKEVEFVTDEEVVKSLTCLFRRFTGDCSIPQPEAMVRSCWSTDGHFYGAYTFPSKESCLGHIKDLGRPLPDSPTVPPIILFAGEHTSPKYYATMHGARESGIREADRIICLTKKFCGPPTKSSCGTCCIPPPPC